MPLLIGSSGHAKRKATAQDSLQNAKAQIKQTTEHENKRNKY